MASAVEQAGSSTETSTPDAWTSDTPISPQLLSSIAVERCAKDPKQQYKHFKRHVLQAGASAEDLQFLLGAVLDVLFLPTVMWRKKYWSLLFTLLDKTSLLHLIAEGSQDASMKVTDSPLPANPGGETLAVIIRLISHQGLHPKSLRLWKQLLDAIGSKTSDLTFQWLEALVLAPVGGRKEFIESYLAHEDFSSLDKQLEERKQAIQSQIKPEAEEQWANLLGEVKTLVMGYKEPQESSGVVLRRVFIGKAQVTVTRQSQEITSKLLSLALRAQTMSRAALGATELSDTNLMLRGPDAYLYILQLALGRALDLSPSSILGRQLAFTLVLMISGNYHDLLPVLQDTRSSMHKKAEALCEQYVEYLADIEALVEGHFKVVDEGNAENELLMASLIHARYGPHFTVATREEAALSAKIHLVRCLTAVPQWTTYPPASIVNYVMELTKAALGAGSDAAEEANNQFIKICLDQWKTGTAKLTLKNAAPLLLDYHEVYKLFIEMEIAQLEQMRTTETMERQAAGIEVWQRPPSNELIQLEKHVQSLVNAELEMPLLSKTVEVWIDAMTTWFEVFGDVATAREIYHRASPLFLKDSHATDLLTRHMAKLISHKQTLLQSSAVAPALDEGINEKAKKRDKPALSEDELQALKAAAEAAKPVFVPRVYAPGLPQHDDNFHLSADLVNALMPSQMAIAPLHSPSPMPTDASTSAMSQATPKNESSDGANAMDVTSEEKSPAQTLQAATTTEPASSVTTLASPPSEPSLPSPPPPTTVPNATANGSTTSTPAAAAAAAHQEAPDSPRPPTPDPIERPPSAPPTLSTPSSGKKNDRSVDLSELEEAQRKFLEKKKRQQSSDEGMTMRFPEEIEQQLAPDQRTKLAQLLQRDEIYGFVKQLEDSQRKSEAALEKERSLMRARHQQRRADLTTAHVARSANTTTEAQLNHAVRQNEMEVNEMETQIRAELAAFEARRLADLNDKQRNQQQVLQAFGVPGFMPTDDPRMVALQKRLLQVIAEEHEKRERNRPKIHVPPSSSPMFPLGNSPLVRSNPTPSPSSMPPRQPAWNASTTPPAPSASPNLFQSTVPTYSSPHNNNQARQPPAKSTTPSNASSPASVGVAASASPSAVPGSSTADLMRQLAILKAQLAITQATQGNPQNPQNPPAAPPSQPPPTGYAPASSPHPAAPASATHGVSHPPAPYAHPAPTVTPHTQHPVSNADALQDLQRQLAAAEHRPTPSYAPPSYPPPAPAPLAAPPPSYYPPPTTRHPHHVPAQTPPMYNAPPQYAPNYYQPPPRSYQPPPPAAYPPPAYGQPKHQPYHPPAYGAPQQSYPPRGSNPNGGYYRDR